MTRCHWEILTVESVWISTAEFPQDDNNPKHLLLCFCGYCIRGMFALFEEVAKAGCILRVSVNFPSASVLIQDATSNK